MALFATLILSLTPSGLQEEPISGKKESFEELSARLLKQSPDDPCIILLCSNWKSPKVCRKLALSKDPKFLAAAVDGLLANDEDPKIRMEAAALLDSWIEKDPKNGYPLLLRGILKVAEGDLGGAVTRLEQASRFNEFKEYGRDTRLAVRQALREKGVTDIVALARILSVARRHTFSTKVLGCFRLLSTCADEEQYRGRLAESERLHRIQLELGLHLARGIENALSAYVFLQSSAAESLYSLALAQGKQSDAARYAGLLRDACRQKALILSAAKRAASEDPLEKLQEEAGLDLGAALLAESRPEILKKINRKMDDLVSHREKELRPIIENYIPRLEREILMGYVREEDRSAVSALKFAIDRLEELREVFYPEKYRAENRVKILSYYHRISEPGEGFEMSDALKQAALQSILDHSDREALSSLLDPVAQVALGDRSPEVIAHLAKAFDQPSIMFDCFRALAKLDRKELLESLLESLKNGMVEQEIPQVVAAAYALRDLTGKDFGVNVERWEKFAAEHADLFKK